MFPCKPELELREAVGMGLWQCEAGGARYSVAWADVADPTRTGAALVEMSRTVAAKMGAEVPAALPLTVPGMTPLPEAAAYRLTGPQGDVRLAVFAHGGRAYQAVRMGARDDATAWATFVGALRVDGVAQAGS